MASTSVCATPLRSAPLTEIQRALQQWQRIIQQWPIDKVRPDTVSFQRIMQRRLDTYFNPKRGSEQPQVTGNAVNVQAVELVWNEAREEKQIQALEKLMSNHFQKRSPLHDQLRFPASSPTYYDDVIKESKRAPSRGLLTRLTDRLKGMIRLS